MNLSKKAEYGLRALIQLGIAHELGVELVPVSELAQTNRLPLKFLERVLMELREAGYVETRRGKAGGYFLARPAGEIGMGDAVRALDGMLAPIACASEFAYRRCTCPDETHCGLRMLMIDVRNAIAGILDRYTLGQVVEVTLRKLRRDGAPLPFIREPAGAQPDHTIHNPADPRLGFLAGLALLREQSNEDDPS